MQIPRTTVYVVLAILAMPLVSAALPTFFQPFEPLIGTRGFEFYEGNEPFFDSILASLIFIGISVRILGKRFGNVVASGLGIALAIAFVVGAGQARFTFGQLWPFATLILMLLLAWIVYSLCVSFGSNRIAAVSLGYAVAWILLGTFAPELLANYPQYFAWLSLLFALSILGILYGGYALLRSLAGGNGFGGGLFNRGSGFQGGGTQFGPGRAFTLGNREDEERVTRDQGIAQDLRRDLNQEPQVRQEEAAAETADQEELRDLGQDITAGAASEAAEAAEEDRATETVEAEWEFIEPELRNIGSEVKEMQRLAPADRQLALPAITSSSQAQLERLNRATQLLNGLSERLRARFPSQTNRPSRPNGLGRATKLVQSLQNKEQVLTKIGVVFKEYESLVSKLSVDTEETKAVPHIRNGLLTINRLIPPTIRDQKPVAEQLSKELPALIVARQRHQQAYDSVAAIFQTVETQRQERLQELERIAERSRTVAEQAVQALQSSDVNAIEKVSAAAAEIRSALRASRMKIREVQGEIQRAQQMLQSLQSEVAQWHQTYRSFEQQLTILEETAGAATVRLIDVSKVHKYLRILFAYQFDPNGAIMKVIMDKFKVIRPENFESAKAIAASMIAKEIDNSRATDEFAVQIQQQALAATLQVWEKELQTRATMGKTNMATRGVN